MAARMISPTLRINELARQMQADGKKVYHLGFGESQCPPPSCLVDALARHAHEVSYLPVQGLPALREAVAKRYADTFGTPIDASRIVITPGSKGALYLAICQLEGDVLLPRPSWVSYAPQAHYSGKQVFWIDTQEQNDYIPTAHELSETIEAAKRNGGNPKILVLNSPNNPSNSVMSEQALQAIAVVARMHDLIVISDEIYANLISNNQCQSISKYYPERTIVTSGLSKDVGVGGWRLGWAVLPDTIESKEWLAIFLSLASELWSSAASPIQYAVTDIFSGAYDDELDFYLKNIQTFHHYRSLALYEGLSRLGLTMPKPLGSYYVYPNFKAFEPLLKQKHIKTSDDLQLYLMEKHHIATLPGTAFGERPEQLTLRLSSTFLDCPTLEASRALWHEWCSLSPGEQKIFVTPKTHPELFTVLEHFAQILSD